MYKSTLSGSSLTLSNVTCPRTRVIFHRKLSQANHVKRIMAARIKDGHEGSFTQPSHHTSCLKKIQERKIEWNSSTNAKTKFDRQRSQSVNCYKDLNTRQKEDFKNKKFPLTAKRKFTPGNMVFKHNKNPSQERRSKIPIFCWKNVDNSKENSKKNYSKTPIGTFRKNVSIFTNNTTISPKVNNNERFQKQIANDVHLGSKTIANKKCHKRAISRPKFSPTESLKEILNDFCLLDRLEDDSKKTFRYRHSNNYYQKNDVKASFNKDASFLVKSEIREPFELPKKVNKGLPKSYKTNSSNEHYVVKKDVKLLEVVTKLAKMPIQTESKDPVIKSKTVTKLTCDGKKSNLVELKSKNETNGNPSYSKISISSADYKTTYSTLSEISIPSSCLLYDTQDTFDFEEKNIPSETGQERFISFNNMEQDFNSEKLPKTTFPTKTKLRQMPVQVPTKIPMAESKINSLKVTRRILNDASMPVNDLSERVSSAENFQKKPIPCQFNSNHNNYEALGIPLTRENPKITQTNEEYMKNPKAVPSKFIGDHECFKSQNVITYSGDVHESEENSDTKVSTWLQSLPATKVLIPEDNSKRHKKLDSNIVDESDFKRPLQGVSENLKTTTSNVPIWSMNRSIKMAEEFSMKSKSCSSLHNTLKPRSNMKSRKSVVDSYMLLGSSATSKIPSWSETEPIRETFESCGDNRFGSSLTHFAELNIKSHVKNRKSVVNSTMLMGKSNDSNVEKEVFKSPH